MRNRLWTTASILAALFATGANAQQAGWNIFTERFISAAHAQDIDWQKVDEALGRKPPSSPATSIVTAFRVPISP